MGAGHDGAAREMQARLRRAGHRAEVRDFLDAAPLRIGAVVRRLYELELRHAPAAYDRTYRVWYRAPWLCPVVSFLVCALTQRRVLRWTRRSQAQVVVSTYPLATQCIGRLRRIGRLRDPDGNPLPAANFITDFGVHPLWVHPGMDINLAVHPTAARHAEARTGRRAVACGPLVADAFAAAAASGEARAAERRRLGLRPEERAVLVVAGSWGVGDVEETLLAVSAGASYVPVVVCGRDHATRRRLERLADATGIRAVVLGWTDEMPALMAGCDALVENAGGLTSLEALRAGLPVVSFHPIAGHGKENTSAMAAAGVSRLAADRRQLLASLDAVTGPGPERIAQLGAGRGMFVSDGASHVLATLLPAAAATLPRPRRARTAWASASRHAAHLGVAAAVAWGGMTTGVGMATAMGAGVAHPAPGLDPVAYVGVRLNADQLLDPRIDREVRRLGITLVVDRVTAFAEPSRIRKLAAEGVDIEDGGQGQWVDPVGRSVEPTPWTRARGDVTAAISLRTLTGEAVRFFVPGRSVNAFDLYDAAAADVSVVRADDVIVAARSTTDLDPNLQPREIIVVNGLYATPAQVLGSLVELQQSLVTARLSAVPIDALT